MSNIFVTCECFQVPQNEFDHLAELINSFCNDKFQILPEDNFEYDEMAVLQKGRKHWGKRRNCSLQGLVWEKVKTEIIC